MTRAVYRFRGFKIGPDLRPEAEPITSEMRCTTCGESSGKAEEFEGGTAWAVKHLKAHPDHLEYREHITRPYRFEPGSWQ
ncbi:DUF7848 domain-containing protein [Streptomyces pacificus]|uniref:DUF7848 domain-containing protein n=1 Tax=Streptomyces pacificus TaxID=2705029 RepID=A0A6A0AP08_9ACTN|nr:hypothetical protein [Streptomyces pacificus]GFH34033.1 hypothetical protein SCWH03_02380 [Streptomyces pacificus]